MKEKENIAILLFSRSAKQESHTKRFSNDPKVNYQIAARLLSAAQAQLETAPYPVFQIDETLQKGNSFGERLGHAFKIIFKKGFNYVIAVGNDCPNLRVDWGEISTQLIDQKIILGPDKRGGVYLIGLSAGSGFESKFLQISWRSKRVFQQLEKQFANCLLLRTKADINTLQDVVDWKFLFSKIIDLINKRISTPIKTVLIPVDYFSPTCLRAPPLSVTFG